MDRKQITAEVEALAKQLLLDSQGSIDYAANAKAIAFAGDDVKKRVIDVVADGYVVTDIRPLQGFGAALMGFRIAVDFDKRETTGAVSLSKRSLIITVEIPNRAVSRIEETTGTPAGGSPAAPFSIMHRDLGAEVRTPLTEIAPRRDAERAYFNEVGVPGFGPGGGMPGDPFGPQPGGGRGRGPIVVNPGGRWGGGLPGGGMSSQTVQGTETLTDVDTQTGCETESDGIADDSGYDDSDYDGARGDDVTNDGETPDRAGRRFF